MVRARRAEDVELRWNKEVNTEVVFAKIEMDNIVRWLVGILPGSLETQGVDKADHSQTPDKDNSKAEKMHRVLVP